MELRDQLALFGLRAFTRGEQSAIPREVVMSSRPRHLTTYAAVLACLVLISCNHAEDEGRPASASQANRYPCGSIRIQIRAVPEDSLAVAERCNLVKIALASLAQAEESSGVDPADTSVIVSALLVPISEETPEGAIVRRTWHITFDLQGRPYDAEVIIDRSSGEAKVTRIHKPL